ncbi:MAG: carbohydrate binding domain-containing protein [Verrucomicrobiota bacterium]
MARLLFRLIRSSRSLSRTSLPRVAAMLFLAAFAPAARASIHVPFVLPWNDSDPTVTDFSGLNSPIGTARVVADANGHLSVNGQRVRFLGMNFAGDAPFCPTNNAEGMAARVAKFGINAIRFHHMDAPWAYNGGLLAYTATTSTNFNATNLERLHYLVSRLKAHGVYSDINLLVGRTYLSGDGLGPEVAGMDWKDVHVLGFFYDPALALQKDYATKLLTPTNRFTGLPLAKDPAVAFVEIINENGLIQKWLDGGLDRMPARYATNLQARWNSWLQARYTNDAALLAAWNIVSESLGTNLLVNGAFSNGVTSWNGEQHYNAHATFNWAYDFNGKPAAKITVTTADTTGWYIQFNQANLKLASNQVYTLSFWAKSSPDTNASFAVMRAHDDYIALGLSQGMSLATNWQLFSNSFQATATETNARVNFGDMGNKLATFWFADVRLQAGGQLGVLPGGATLAAGNVPNLAYSGTGYTGTKAARRDFLRFLRDLENAYYDAMVGHLRTNCGYAGVIFGSIVACSPATVQSRLDLVDAHAYWQHPQFPGVAWDPVNWYQTNSSMAGTLADDNTLTGLARQRVQGKPFTVTEYDHPSPNYHGSEAPLLLAAYAALQDWDGVWMFAYGPGNAMSTMGYVSGYFDIAQHPLKMANMLLAANLFRRGDVQPAAQEITLAFTPEQELDLLQNTWAWSLFGSGRLGMPGPFAFTNRLSVSVGSNAVGLTTAPTWTGGTKVTSDTSELTWDASAPGGGLVSIGSRRSKALIGAADNKVVNLGDGVTLQPFTTDLHWCTLGATLTQGDVFTNDCTMIVAAGGWWENSGQIWTDTNKMSVGNHWGSAPVMAEVVPFSLTLPAPASAVTAWILDERGERYDTLPVTGNATSAVVNVSSFANSIWYEVDVARWTASFDLWRLRYFGSTQPGVPAGSVEEAAPFGDHVPNLMKYYLGLAGDAAAAGNQLPVGSVVSSAGTNYLAFTYTHDKLVADADCVAEVSTDLVHWFSGPGYTAVHSVVDQGTTEQITVRDAAPAGTPVQHYLRLRFQRH